MANDRKIQPPTSLIGSKIHLLRGHRVMLDADLAELYGVETRILVQAVKRNDFRFPSDFMFQLDATEFSNLRSQFVISSWGGRRSAPYAFTEQGVAMLSSILSSPQAVVINIQIMRTFVMVRQLASTYQDLATRLDELEAKTEHLNIKHDAFANTTRKQLKEIFEVLRQLTTPPDPPKRPIGFIQHEEQKPNDKPKAKAAKK